MSNQLAFSLGLATESFLHPLQRVTEKIRDFTGDALRLPGLGAAVGSLAAGFLSLDAIVENVWKQIEHGAALNVLSKQTSESVKNLYLLEAGFKGARLSADLVGPAVFAMQRSLGGVNEFGEDTKSIFHQLNLDIDSLKQAGASGALAPILQAISGLSPEAAAKASSTIFGRGLGREMLQLARSGDEFAIAMDHAADRAEIFARNAAGFERLEHSVERIKALGTGFFLGIAEGAAPGISAAAEAINHIDLTGLGQQLGSLIAGLGEAIHQGRVGEILELSLKAGIKGAMDFFKGQLVGPDSIFGGAQGLGHAFSTGLQEIFVRDQRGNILGELIQKAFNQASGINAPPAENPFRDQLAKLLSGLSADALKAFQGTESGLGGANTLANTKELTTRSLRSDNSDVNALERIGLVRLGGPGGSDYAQQTSRNTQQTVSLLDRTNATLDRIWKRQNDAARNEFGNI